MDAGESRSRDRMSRRRRSVRLTRDVKVPRQRREDA